jgi:hypothetical protein
LNGGGEERSATIARGGPPVSQLPDHPVEVNLTAALHHEHIARVVSRIVEPEANHSRLPVFLFNCFKLKSVGISDVRL